jgi:hypothetical protein
VPTQDLVLPPADGGGEATEFDDVGGAAVRVEALKTTACPAIRRGGVHLALQLLGEVDGADLTGVIARRQPCLDAGPAPVGQPLVSHEQLAADSRERLALAAPVAVGVLLDSAADLVQGAVANRTAWDDSGGTPGTYGSPAGVGGPGRGGLASVEEDGGRLDGPLGSAGSVSETQAALAHSCGQGGGTGPGPDPL